MVKYLSLISAFQWKKKWPKRLRRVRRKRSRRQRVDGHQIPFDLMIEILRRLPAKSLMKFKCVSKLWSGLIRSRYFSNLHLTVASPSRPPIRLYMSLVENYKCNFRNFYLCQCPRKTQLLSLTSSGNSVESSLEPDMTFPGMGGHNMVVLRGLILYSVCRKAIIYNPATRQNLTLPTIKSNIFSQKEPIKYVYYFFGHDPVLDQYKIVCTIVIYPEDHEKIISEYWVFVLEPGGIWKRVEYYEQPHMPTSDGLCFNGVIYYLAFTHTCRYNVFRFDLRSEEIRVIQAPHEVSQFGVHVGFIEHSGKPALFDYTHIRETFVSELWVLEDGLGGTWSRKSLVLKPCQRYLVDGINITDLKVHGTAQNNEVILALPCPCYLLYYDLIKNDLRKVNIMRATTPNQPSYVYFKVMDKSESIMHLET